MPRTSLVSDASREERELREYLGEEFELARLQQYERTLADEFVGCGDEARFYRVSRGYLYNLTAFAMTDTKLPYLNDLVGLVAPGSRLLDYGCGIGSDGLLLLEAGYRVEFADFSNPSTEYLRWRLRRRGLEAPVHDLDGEVPGGFDAAFAFDVIEHVDDPFAFLAEMEQRARIVEVNLLEPGDDDPVIHRALPIAAILRRAAGLRLLRYRVVHGRSHLVAYGSEAGGPSARAAGQVRLMAGRARGRIGR